MSIAGRRFFGCDSRRFVHPICVVHIFLTALHSHDSMLQLKNSGNLILSIHLIFKDEPTFVEKSILAPPGHGTQAGSSLENFNYVYIIYYYHYGDVIVV